MDNLLFLGGPHGSGKTTLAELIKVELPRVLIPELITRTPKFYSESLGFEVDFFQRQVLKHAQRAIENYEYLEIARKNPDKLILANRCIYDVLSYHEAYFQRGWISEGEKESICKNLEILFSKELTKPNAIILNPGLSVCYSHLKHRWETKKKKFMEEDTEYLSAACNSYEGFRDYSNVLYIDHEIDLKSRDDLDEIFGWIENLRGVLV